MNIAIIFAGGTGQRFSNENLPKQFVEVEQKPIIIHTLEIFENHSLIDKIYISIHPQYYTLMCELVTRHKLNKVKGIVYGGETAQESIYNALIKAQIENPDNSIVLIHDGVRPIVDDNVIDENIKNVKIYGNSITCTPCYETILVSDNGINPQKIPYRKNTYAAQAPQCFYLKEIIEAHEQIRKLKPNYEDMIDSCTIFHTLNKPMYMCNGNFGNIKVTTPRDLYILEALIKYRKRENYELHRCN
ncbi:2-C-methyl-D-erythritol 4-phosphate cytidylyltransferase [Brachyspira sp. CAG:484]|nr:2-C-methyl-D-erythritol 4-phosphate cytidylyltransferase [Brachyspira sp. CAG:484]